MKTMFMIIILLVPSAALATSIVAVRNSNEIVIGADSSTTLTRSDGASEGGMEKCKIVQAGRQETFFASSGLAGIGPAKQPGSIYPAYDLKGLIARGLEGGGPVGARVDSLEKVLVLKLSQIAERASKDDAGFFVERFAGRQLFTVIIAAMDDGRPVLLARTFTLNVSSSGFSFVIGRYACPGDCRAPSVTVFAGQTGGLRRYLRENGAIASGAGPVNLVRNLVEFEISRAPASVGPPVDILRLTGDGAEWIQKKSICPDIRK